jgi:HupE / UreJ protein
MSDFSLFLKLGFDHITDLAGYDHILFIVALCAIYRLQDWKVVLILVTAFTLGHSITLALATLNIIQYSTKTIELLIPCTILFTAIANFFSVDDQKPFAPVKSIQPIRYLMATGFGLIHGMGFSNYLRSLLGNEDSIWQPLLAFNVGLEIGQLVIVALSLVLSFVVLDIFRIKKHDWKLIVSGIIAGIVLTMIKERWGK